jgi:heat shock protein HslJ
MSRRYAPRIESRRPFRQIGVAIAAVVILAALLPGASLAQPGTVRPDDIEIRWQLLEYRDANGKLTAVPPGISVTFLPFGGVLQGNGACSTYETTYTQTANAINIETPQIDAVPCDSSAQAVDDAFYKALAGASGKSLEGDILRLYGVTDEPLLTLTAATIPFDPTIAPWELARIGDPDGGIETITVGAPTMEFLRGGGSGDQLSGHVVGSTGCGTFLGSFRTNDSSMRITDVAYRPSSCTEALAEQAQGFIDTFDTITDFQILPAGLTLEDANGRARLAFSPSIELGEDVWTPTEILAPSGEALDLTPVQLSTSAVQFFGGQVQGRTYCRPFDGSSLGAALALSVFKLSPLGKCGRNESGKIIDAAFLDALKATASQALRGDELELLDRTGAVRMRLLRQAPLEGPTWILWKMDQKPKAKGGVREVLPETPTPITATFTDIGGVVKGDTGAATAISTNDYFANFTARAAVIEIGTLNVNGRACKKRSPMCAQQNIFKSLMESATGYISRGTNLQLLQGQTTVLWFCNPTQPSPECPTSLTPAE